MIIPDLRGHGQSTSPQTAEGYPADCLATDLARMIDGVLGVRKGGRVFVVWSGSARW